MGLGALGCGDSGSEDAAFDRPVPHIGRGPGYELPPAGEKVAAGRAVDGLRCGPRKRERFGVHLEIFAKWLDVVVPARIGIAPPRVRDGAYVRSGRCEYPARTFEPTGLIEVDSGAELTLGQFFDLWGQPLGRTRLAGFRTNAASPVRAYVDGRRWRRDLRAIPLRRHAEIVLELGAFVPPHPSYRFERGL